MCTLNKRGAGEEGEDQNSLQINSTDSAGRAWHCSMSLAMLDLVTFPQIRSVRKSLQRMKKFLCVLMKFSLHT